MQLVVSGIPEFIRGTQPKLSCQLVPAELFKKEDPMPDVNASLNEGKGHEENTHQEGASGSTEAEFKSPEKE